MADTPHPGGRPTILDQALVDKARGYLATCKDSYRYIDEVPETADLEEICTDPECDTECGKSHELHEVTRPKRRLYVGRSRLNVQLPSIAGLAVYLGVSRETIRLWAKNESENPLEKEFFGIVEDILAEQENRLVSKGISGEYNPTIAKLILGKHGYSDKTDITSGDKPIQATPEAQALAAQAIDSFFKNNGTTEPPATPGQ